MTVTKLGLAQAFAALSSATFIPWNKPSGLNAWGFECDVPSNFNNDPYCQVAANYPDPHFKSAASVVSEYCTDYFHITASTVVATAKVTQKVTTTVTTNGATVTVTPPASVTSYASTQTCFQNTATAHPAQKRNFGSGWSKGGSSPTFESPSNPFQDPLVSKACSCFGVNFSPSTTIKSVATVTAVATVTKTSTLTVYATPAAASGGVKTVYVPQSGTYQATNGTALNNGTTSGGNSIFTEYNGYDFYGGDLARGQCVAGLPSEVDTSVGWYEYCVDFNSCLEICSAYNSANAKQPSPDSPCVGVTYVGGFCYLKSAVPGDGAANCSPDSSPTALSAILGVVTTPK